MVKKLKKIEDLKGFSRYYCTKCKHSHVRKYKYKIDENGVQIKTKDTPFFNHRETAWELTDSEIWHAKLSRSLENYTIKGHKKATGSKKQ